ncbi:MAG: DUF6398 domain-containing protein [Actinomycetota bacterium]|nr:DUF6398 domain-containing protein [Actinomycetota bacterium]
MDDVRRALRDDHPFSFLAFASTLLAVVDPRSREPFERPGEGRRQLDRDELVGTLIEVRQRETTALLAAFAEMTPDEVLAVRLRRELASRDDPLPTWLTRLGETEAYRAVEMVHVLGDGDNVMVGARFPTGDELTVAVYIDHNLGTLVKDAFVVPDTLAGLVEFMREKSGDDPDTAWNDVDRRDARARITEAIDVGAKVFPPFETDTWPACRPLVEWVARLLPPGGSGYVRPQWSDADLEALSGRFLSSPFAADLDGDHVSLLQHVLWFATDYGPGDPLRWSPVAVELLLADWMPRKVVAEPRYLSKAPDLLRSFVRFCHAERGLSAGLTNETLAAVDRWEPEYQRAIRSARPQGPAALLAALGLLDHEPADYRQVMLVTLSQAVGGEEALDALGTAPLPSEEFRWDGIPDDIRPAVSEVLALCDRCCDELLDVEYRTACRRFLAMVASNGPAVFRRGARPEPAAAAVCWTVGKANELFTPSGGGMRVKDLLGHFGQSSVSQKARTLLHAGGFAEEGRYGEIVLGLPDLLVSARRRTIIERRDRFRALLEEDRLG